MRKLLQAKIKELDFYATTAFEVVDIDIAESCRSTIDEIQAKALRAGLPEVVAATQRPGGGLKWAREVVAACLAALPDQATDGLLSLQEAAEYLGYKPAGLRKLVKRGSIRHLQVGQGPIKFRREWLDEFVADVNATGELPKAAKAPPVRIEPQFGFDPKLLR